MINTRAYIPREEQDQEEYPLTIEHVKQFLATKGDHDSLGYCYCATNCLLSYTLDWLYPERKHWRVDLCDYSSARHGIYDGLLDPACYFLRCAFDRCGGGLEGNPEVTKTRMRAYLESIVMDKEDRIGETEIPFDVDDLFGE